MKVNNIHRGNGHFDAGYVHIASQEVANICKVLYEVAYVEGGIHK